MTQPDVAQAFDTCSRSLETIFFLLILGTSSVPISLTQHCQLQNKPLIVYRTEQQTLEIYPWSLNLTSVLPALSPILTTIMACILLSSISNNISQGIKAEKSKVISARYCASVVLLSSLLCQNTRQKQLKKGFILAYLSRALWWEGTMAPWPATSHP